MTPTRDAILDIVAKEASIQRDRLVPGATLASLDIASLDIVTVLFEIEDRFGIEVPPEAIPADGTLDVLIGIVLARSGTS